MKKSLFIFLACFLFAINLYAIPPSPPPTAGAGTGDVLADGSVPFTGSVTLDDGTTDSPSLIFKDSDDETVTCVKKQGASGAGYLQCTTAAGDGFQILTGNLKVGNGTPGQTINGEDAYVEGLLEVDGVIYADGGVTGNVTGTATGLAIASQAAGDILYFNGTNWVRLAKDSGKYLKSGDAAVSWDSPTGSGDVLSIGNCESGACLDGTSDGGTNILFYDAQGATTLQVGDNSDAVVLTLPITTGTLATVAGTLANTVLDDTKGNGDTAFVWSADKVYDQLALKQDADADLTAIAALSCTENQIIKRNGAGAWVCGADDNSGSNTSITDIGDASGDGSISVAGYETTITSTLDEAAHSVLTIIDTDADAANATTILTLKHNDGADADVTYLKMVGDADGTPTNDYVFTQTGFTSLLPVNVPAEAYDATSWNGNTSAPQKDAIRDYLESKIPAGADGSYRMVMTNNTAISPTGSAYEVYFDGGVFKWNENGTERTPVKTSDLGSNVGTFLTTPSLANLGSALTDEGTGVIAALGNATNGSGGFITYGNAAGTAAPLTGYSKGAGTVASTDTILQAIQKLDGNDDAKAPLANPQFTGVVDIAANATTDAEGEMTIDTTTNQFRYYGGAQRVLSPIQSASFVITAPADTDDINIMKAPYGMTILGIDCIVQGTTSATGQLQECTSAGASCADLDSDITCDADGAADDGTLTDSTIASGAWLRWKTTSLSGTPTFLTVTFRYLVVAD